MGALAKSFENVLHGLSTFEKEFPKLIEKFTGSLGAERDLTALNLLLKSFDKNLSGAVSVLVKAKPEKLQACAKSVFEIAKLYLSKIETSKDGYMTSAAEGALERIRDTAKKIETAKAIDSKQSEELKSSVNIWSKVKDRQKQIFEAKVTQERKEAGEHAKMFKEAWALYKKIDAKTTFDLIKSWEISPEGKKRSLADPINQKVEAFIKSLSQALEDASLEKFNDQLYNAVSDPLELFKREYRNAYAVVKAPGLVKKVLEKAEEAGVVKNGGKK
ncbi:MAG: hypothetical protein WCL32_18060 [Planctomycetota bacterium]